MKFTLEHAAAGLALVLIAYTMGKRAQSTPTATSSNEITDPTQWWSYAGQWS